MAVGQVPLETDLRGMLNRRRGFHALFWLCGWGAAAAIALTALAVTSQTKSAGERLRAIFAANEPAAVAQIPPRVAQLESETDTLVAQVRALTIDRDRLAGRIALLESSIDDMTGAIKRQADATTAALAARTAPPAPTPAPQPPTRPIPTADAGKALPPAPPAPSTVAAVASISGRDKLADEAANAIAAADVQSPSISNEFGLDLGGAPTLDGIRQRWTMVKAAFGPLLSGMRPVAARERRPGNAAYRLVVGPLPNSPTATSLCAHFNAARTPCRAAKFDGEDIALAQH